MKKLFDTPEKCLETLGEHCLEEHDGICRLEGCCVLHYGDPIPYRICMHCSFRQELVTIQEKVAEWKP